MTISKNSIHRLKSAVRRKCLYLIVGTISLVSIPYTHFERGWSWYMSAVVYFPYIIVSVWQIASAFSEAAWSLDAEINEGARKIVRDNVTAIILIFLVGLAKKGIPDEDFKLAMEKTKSVLLGLVLVYTWLGIVRAVLATRWKKVGGDADAESRVGAGEVHGGASASCEPALVGGSGGCGAAAVGPDGGQSGEGRTSVVAQVDNKNGRGWLMLATGVVIGVLANGVVVRRLRRN